MITKELVDFIRKMRIEKHSDTEIQSMLTSNGWLSVDVMEAFQSIDMAARNTGVPVATPAVAPATPKSFEMPSSIRELNANPVSPVNPVNINNANPINPINVNPQVNLQPHNNYEPLYVGVPKEKSVSHKGLITTFVIIFLVLALGASGYFYRDNLKSLPIIKNFFPATIVPQAITEVPTPVLPATPAILDCAGSVDCLVQAAQNNCQLAKVDYATSIPLPFVNPPDRPNLITANSTRHLEIQGKDVDNCIIYEKLTNSSVFINQDELAKITNITAKDKASSAALIDTMNKSAAVAIGRDAFCKVTPLEFKTKMDNEKEGNFSLSFSVDVKTGKSINKDPYAAKCVGELYHPKSGVAVKHDDPNCTLRSSSADFTVGLNVTISGMIRAFYYTGKPEQVSWVSADPSIVKVTNSTGDGSQVKFKGIKKGKTSLLVTDNAVNKDCNVTVNMTVDSTF